MKTSFGNPLTRLLWGGVVPTAVERTLLQAGIESFPERLRTPLLAQVEACNLVQREHDGRALNFYRKQGGAVTRDGLPELPIKPGEVRLLGIAFELAGRAGRLNATMTAVDRQFFCLSLSHDLRSAGAGTQVRIVDMVQSWRSSLLPPCDADAQAGTRNL